MKRKLLCLLLCLSLFSVLSLPASAKGNQPLVMDNAVLMTSEDVASLEEMARALTTEYEMDIVILTVPGIGNKTPEEYADNFYDENQYGWGDSYSGMLFLLSMEERDWYISTYADAIYALTDYGIQQTAEAALPYFSSGDYYSGFYAWLDSLNAYLAAYRSGKPIDGWADYSKDNYHGTQETIVYIQQTPSLLTAMVIGLFVAGVTLFLMYGAMNSKRPRNSAGSYMKDGSFCIGIHRDLFLYSNVTKTPKPQNHGNQGGGSSVHRSSSGRSHGGGGGKF